MKMRLLVAAVALCVAGQVESAGRGDMKITLGKEQYASLPVCLSKESAIAVVKEEAAKGFEAGHAIYNADDKCNFLNGVMVTPVRVIDRFVPTDDRKPINVIEVKINGQTGYSWSSLEIAGELGT